MTLDGYLLGVIIAAVVSLVGVAFGYGALTSKVSTNAKDIKHLKECQDAVDTKLDDIRTKVARIETILNGKKRKS